MMKAKASKGESRNAKHQSQGGKLISEASLKGKLLQSCYRCCFACVILNACFLSSLLPRLRLAGVWLSRSSGLSGVWIELALSGRANKNHGENVLSVTMGIAFCVSIVACRMVVIHFTSGPGVSPRSSIICFLVVCGGNHVL